MASNISEVSASLLVNNFDLCILSLGQKLCSLACAEDISCSLIDLCYAQNVLAFLIVCLLKTCSGSSGQL